MAETEYFVGAKVCRLCRGYYRHGCQVDQRVCWDCFYDRVDAPTGSARRMAQMAQFTSDVEGASPVEKAANAKAAFRAAEGVVQLAEDLEAGRPSLPPELSQQAQDLIALKKDLEDG